MQAGGSWSSGGGGLLKDTRNPWFLNNTDKVTYCINIDEKNFGASRELVRAQIESAIKYWKNEFTYAVLPNLKDYGQLKIATQDFFEVDCLDKNVDIQFQFGILNSEQEQYLQRPNEFGAISVRTDYDQISLKARGFVYVSPAKGRLAYNSTSIDANVWSKNGGVVLYLTLLHELGHVFGFPHMGRAGSLMSESFVETLLLKGSDLDLYLESIKTYLQLPESVKPYCASELLLKRWNQFFGLKENQKCLRVNFEYQGHQLFGSTVAKFFAGSSPNEMTEIGRAQLSMQSFFVDQISVIWLTDFQKIFSKKDITQFGVSGILGVSLMGVKKTGKFISTDGKHQRAIIARFDQGTRLISIDGIEGVEIITLF